ncbi:hypothetical protein K504DRAFT_504120 [Pleomassaria siparia CBS 279.74]|uniref:Uncharacterized protein n=1 Tax=Pleomassaria siparia CBS 279.74 TaxID=1314801 RepID=A0A6G1K6A5_9PLEO|nr:hypothetical protein K504DRAFT_504120 [Pleomassaria siparia CBS 279.74]
MSLGAGTVSLSLRLLEPFACKPSSHARGLKLLEVLPRPAFCHESHLGALIGRVPTSMLPHTMSSTHPSVKGPAAPPSHLLLPLPLSVILLLPSLPTYPTAWPKHSPRVFQSFLQAGHAGAAALCPSSEASQIPFWNGRDPHCRLTPIRFESPLVDNRPYCCPSSSESVYFPHDHCSAAPSRYLLYDRFWTLLRYYPSSPKSHLRLE